VLRSYEPHDPSAAGLYIRDVLARRISVSTRTLALAYALNRMDHNERVILPFLNGGPDRLILCDRYMLSSLVYQGLAGGPLTIEEVAQINGGARQPDLTIFLDASPDTAYARIGSRGGPRELFDEQLAEIRGRYLTAIAWMRARGAAIRVINADPDYPTVYAAVCDALIEAGPHWLQAANL
jgi:dTMP kinase